MKTKQQSKGAARQESPSVPLVRQEQEATTTASADTILKLIQIEIDMSKWLSSLAAIVVAGSLSVIDKLPEDAQTFLLYAVFVAVLSISSGALVFLFGRRDAIRLSEGLECEHRSNAERRLTYQYVLTLVTLGLISYVGLRLASSHKVATPPPPAQEQPKTPLKSS